MDTSQPIDEKRKSAEWRLGHGAVFLTIALLTLFVVGFVIFDGWEFVKVVSVSEPAVTNPTPGKTDPY